jgi:flagellar biosynthesis chaperone FliJ
MAAFKFALQGLKKFRNHRLLNARRELLVVDDRIRRIKEAIQIAQQEKSELIGDSQNFKNLSLALAAPHIMRGRELKISGFREDLQELEKERERYQAWVTEMGRELKVVEKLEQKKRDAFVTAEKMKEKRVVDGWASENETRKRMREEENEDS